MLKTWCLSLSEQETRLLLMVERLSQFMLIILFREHMASLFTLLMALLFILVILGLTERSLR